MMTSPLHLNCVLAATSLAVACHAGAQTMEIKWGGDGRFSRTVTIAPAKAFEFCGALQSGQKMLWSFESSQPLAYAVHKLGGDDKVAVSPPGKEWKFSGKIEASSSGRFCWSWTNDGNKSVELALDIKPQS